MSEKLAPGTLCVVCEDLATGKHYSVASCNGCKTFFRRAIVNKRNFVCMGNGNCPVNKGVRCACRHCRLKKCLSVGMDTKSIQNDRDRIGYTKRTRKCDKEKASVPEIKLEYPFGDEIIEQSRQDHLEYISPVGSVHNGQDIQALNDPMLERLTLLENNFTLLLSRAKIEPYASLDDALQAPSKFHGPIDVKVSDPIATPEPGEEHKRMPFWRSRIIALYIDWAKTFSTFRNLPQSDKVALITNHASSYMIMCEAFRTPDHADERAVTNCLLMNESIFDYGKEVSDHSNGCTPAPPDMIRLPTEYGSLPPDYGSWLPADYGSPLTGTEQKSNMHTFFDQRLLLEGKNSENGQKHSVEQTIPTTYPIVGSLSGLTPVMACMIDYVMKPFRQLNISTTEFALLQAIMFFDPDTEGIDSASQRNVVAEQKRLISALHRCVTQDYDPTHAQDRFTNILLRIPTIRKVAAKKNESLQIIDLFNLFTLNSLVKETVGIRSNAPTPNSTSSVNL